MHLTLPVHTGQRHALRAGASALAAMLVAACTAEPTGLHRLYVLDCGRLIAHDQSRWTPDVNIGQARELSNNCYLLRHARGTLLWETGVPDSVVAYPGGIRSPNGAVTWFRDRTLRGQLDSLGIDLSDITYVAMSHTHGDHVGNTGLFTASTLLMQRIEYETATGLTLPPLGDDRGVEALSGDFDVFGDGSVTIISTPGHTPGHQSLLVRLPRTGALVLTGDLVHFRYMWDNKIVPPFNFSAEQSLASIDRVAALVARHDAQLWIGHDKDITAGINRWPRYYD